MLFEPELELVFATDETGIAALAKLDADDCVGTLTVLAVVFVFPLILLIDLWLLLMVVDRIRAGVLLGGIVEVDSILITLAVFASEVCPAGPA